MIEFFTNIGNWIVCNIDKITAFFSSATVIGLVTAGCALWKLIVSVRANTKKVENVTDALTNDKQLTDDVNAIRQGSKDTDNAVKTCLSKVSDIDAKFKEFELLMNSKIDAMLEVQNIVYSTIKDDSIRNTVNSIIVNAKHKSDVTKAQLEKELEELKAEFDNFVASTGNTISETVNKVKATAGIISDTPKTNEVDKESIDVVRY